jgi:hypothetical protein
MKSISLVSDRSSLLAANRHPIASRFQPPPSPALPHLSGVTAGDVPQPSYQRRSHSTADAAEGVDELDPARCRCAGQDHGRHRPERTLGSIEPRRGKAHSRQGPPGAHRCASYQRPTVAILQVAHNNSLLVVLVSYGYIFEDTTIITL